MKISINKDGPWVDVKITEDTKRKPLEMRLHESDLASIQKLFAMAQKSQQFRFEYETG